MGNSPSRKNKKLEKAIQSRKVKRAKRWLMNGANPNAYSKKSNYSFLSMSITLREEKLVSTLLQFDADPDQKSWLPIGKGTIQRKYNNDDEYPIHIAAAVGSEKIMRALLNSTIDINLGQDHKLGTALHQTARFGNARLADLLLCRGADIIGIDSRLNIPLHIASMFGQTRVAEVLLRYGSPVNTPNMKNWTPLHYASSEGAFSMVKLLLRHGGNPDIIDGAGNTPISLAKSERILEAFLEYAMDNPNEDNSVFENDFEIEEDTTSVPAKPARTFAFPSRIIYRNRFDGGIINRSFSQEGINESGKGKKVEKTKSYSDFGRWLRRKNWRKSKKYREKVVVEDTNVIGNNFRRTKSIPTKQVTNHKADNQNGSVVKDKNESGMSRNFIRTMSTPVRHRPKKVNNVEQNTPQNKKLKKVNEKETVIEPPHTSTNFRRTKSTPISKHRRQKRKQQHTKQVLIKHSNSLRLQHGVKQPMHRRTRSERGAKQKALENETFDNSHESQEIIIHRRTKSTTNLTGRQTKARQIDQKSTVKNKEISDKSSKTERATEQQVNHTPNHKKQLISPSLWRSLDNLSTANDHLKSDIVIKDTNHNFQTKRGTIRTMSEKFVSRLKKDQQNLITEQRQKESHGH